MAGTPEEDLLGWLEREEERLGFVSVDDALSDIAKARDLFYDELGYDITDEQFKGLGEALNLRYHELPEIDINYSRVEQSWGFQPVYRSTVTGRFVSGADVRAGLAELRG